MRDSVDFGIDLGTGFSGIAVWQNGDAVMIKNNDGADLTPSAVWITGDGETLVGQAARVADPDDVAMEFKLEMGAAGAVRHFASAGVSLTPQQLSAEVLKSLRADAAELHDEPTAAVITVPAAFLLNQNHATGEAAALAGLGANCPLVQEPTAAAFAYGLADSTDRADWMVFDFGSGTFDAAVVSKREGRLHVLDHAGDPNLGGKLIDWAVVEQLLAPAVAAAFGLPDFTRANPRWRTHFIRLKLAAEEAKIQLSRRDRCKVVPMPPLTDEAGRPLPFEHVLTRGEVDRLAEPFYLRAIARCREALSQGNLHPDKIQRLLLVGGVTLAPGLRERLADPREGLGIELDHSQDPRSVVARGAALFAHTVPLNRPAAAPRAGEFTLELRYQKVTASTEPVVAGRLRASGTVDWTRYTVTFADPTARPPFRTGKIAVDAGGTFVADLRLTENATSTFTIELADATGSRQRLTPDTMEITHGLEFGGAVLTHSLGIGQADRTFKPVLHRGARLPARNRATFRTTTGLRRTDTDAVVRIPIREGERRRADRNRHVAVVRIRPRDARIDVPLGSDVEITFTVDESRRVSVVADVPLLRQQFEAEIDLADVPAPSVDDLESRLSELRVRRDTLGDGGADAAAPALASAEEMVSRARGELDAARSDVGSAVACEQTMLDAHAALDDLEATAELPAKLDSLRVGLEACRELTARHGDAADRHELADLERAAGAVVQDSATADKLIHRAVELQVHLLRRSGGLEAAIFHAFRNDRALLRPQDRVDALLREGERAMAAGDRTALSAVNERLRRMWPQDAPLPTDSDVQET